MTQDSTSASCDEQTEAQVSGVHSYVLANYLTDDLLVRLLKLAILGLPVFLPRNVICKVMYQQGLQAKKE